MTFASLRLIDIHQQLLKDLKSGNFELLDLLHHLSAGYKACYTKITYEGSDMLRQACGGAGFLNWSSLPYLVQNYSPNTTLEGDNTVMLQQTAKLIIKTFKAVQKGQPATGYFSYLNKIEELTSCKPKLQKVEDFTCLV